MFPTTLLVTLGLLILIAFTGRFFVQLPRNNWLLFAAQPLAMCSSSMVVFAGGLLGEKIAPTPELATLPITGLIIGTAVAVIPASMLMKKLGRRLGTIFGLLLSVIGALLCMFAAIDSIFSLLIAGSVLMGASMAFVAQMRFAAIESLPDLTDSPKAVSVLMVSGMFAAMLGPELAETGQYWIDSAHGFAGSFLGLAIMVSLSMLIVARLDPIGVAETKTGSVARPLKQIIRQPVFIIAVCAGAIGYSVMSYIMTATPLSMHSLQGHSLQATKWVIQSHIIAMYLPSLFSALFIRYLGKANMMIMGCLLYVGVIIFALTGKQVMHYWWALVLLGVGWNFLYTAGTLLLPESYSVDERFKTQAVNDFIIFFVQAIGSLSAGYILFSQGWSLLILVAVPMVIIMFGISVWYFLIRQKIDQLAL